MVATQEHSHETSEHPCRRLQSSWPAAAPVGKKDFACNETAAKSFRSNLDSTQTGSVENDVSIADLPAQIGHVNVQHVAVAG